MELLLSYYERVEAPRAIETWKRDSKIFLVGIRFEVVESEVKAGWICYALNPGWKDMPRDFFDTSRPCSVCSVVGRRSLMTQRSCHKRHRTRGNNKRRLFTPSSIVHDSDQETHNHGAIMAVQKLYPRSTIKRIVKAHSKKSVSKNADVLVRHLSRSNHSVD